MEKAEFSLLFGAFIKEMRNKRKMTQPELADKLGNNFQNISSLERGEYTITIFTAYKIAMAFNISLSTLFNDYEEFLVSKKD
jgi:transcriptional regulator with XRE-family HTH domain